MRNHACGAIMHRALIVFCHARGPRDRNVALLTARGAKRHNLILSLEYRAAPLQGENNMRGTRTFAFLALAVVLGLATIAVGGLGSASAAPPDPCFHAATCI